MIDMSYRNYSRKTISIICIFVFAIIVAIFIIGINFFDISLILPTLIPLIIISIIVIIVIRFSWESQKYCPRCNIPISVYSEYCRNCGLKLITLCPDCNKYLRIGTNLCNNCGHKFDFFDESKEKPEFEIVQKGSPAPEQANFCPTCGANLKNTENLRFCEFCGARLKK